MDRAGFEKHEIVFFLVPDFSLIAFATAIEALRIANRFLPRPAYEWTIASADGAPVASSSGLEIRADASIAALSSAAPPEMALVCGGLNIERFHDPAVFQWLRRLAGGGVITGSLCTGAWVLAEAGLLEGRECAIHWENLPAFSERFPRTRAHADLFIADGNFYTCAGGTAALDMMVRLVSRHFGREVGDKICEQALIDHARAPRERQRMPLCSRLGASHPKLLFIIELMEANISEPLELVDIARYAGLSRRQVERLFSKHVGRPPARYYLDLRLEHAQRLLAQTSMPVIEVAIACGFTSASHFSKCYRRLYNHPPHAERTRRRTA